MLYCVDYYCMRQLCRGYVEAINEGGAMRIAGENLDSRVCKVVPAQEASESAFTEKSITFNFRHPLVRASLNEGAARYGGGAV